MSFYAHTKTRPDGTRAPQSEWEPLFTPFGEEENECQRDTCKKCQEMDPDHGHLNKVAYWTAKFATEMFPEDSDESKLAHQWGYLTGLWHDLGKFASEWQSYLASKSDPHQEEKDLFFLLHSDLHYSCDFGLHPKPGIDSPSSQTLL